MMSNIFSLARTCVKFIGSWLAIWGLGYYRFSPSWVAFGAVGYMVFHRAQEKKELISSAMRAIGADEKSAILNNIGVRELPTWVFFPDIERAEWLNKVVQRTWPYISEYVTKVLVETVQPAVNDNLPPYLQPFAFLRTDLGDTPPRIGGIKVYTEESIHRDEIVMDIDLLLYSDARIKVSVGKIIAGVKDFELRGTLRVLIKPLVPKIPFAGAVTVCFLDNPYVNFLLTHLGNILTMPGLQQTLNRTIQDAVSSLCVLPNRVSVSLVDDVVVEQLKFPSAQGVVRVKIISACNLAAADVNVLGKNFSDPYCVVRVGAQKFVTAVKKKTLNPSWNECFEAVVDQKVGQSVIIEVWDEDKNTKDDELGSTSIPIEQVYLRGKLSSHMTLQGVNVTGSVNVEVTWLDLSNNPSHFAEVEQAYQEASVSEKAKLTCYLFVRVEQAKHLQRLKFMQEPSPYCLLQIDNCVQNTVARDKTQNPLWESPHHFLLSNPDIQSLNIEIRDSRSDVVLGTLEIPLKHLKAESDMKVTRPYALRAAGPEEACLYLHLELRALKPGRDRRPLAERDSIDIGNPSQISSPSNNGQNGKMEEPPSSSIFTDVDEGHTNIVRNRNDGLKGYSVSNLDDVFETLSVIAPPNSAGRLKLTLHYNANMETLKVTVDCAEKLLGVDKDGLSDPYAKLSVVDASGHIIGEVKKTHTFKNELNPKFGDSFKFPVKSEVLDGCKLQVEIKNHIGLLQRSSHSRLMGSVSIDLRDLKFNDEWTEWYWLKNPME